MKETLAASWNPITFEVTHIHVVSRRTHEGQMHSVPLGVILDKAISCSPYPSPLEVFPYRGGGEGATTDGSPPDASMLMEAPQWGSRVLTLYVPKDSLEAWMLSVTLTDLARSTPTHISQLGAMYHVPSHLLRQYLARWADALSAAETTPFFMEEVRGDVFRLYLDVDIKLTKPEKVDLLAGGCGFYKAVTDFTRGFFPSAKSTTFVVTECHGPWEDKTEPLVVYKSGFRLHFQHIFVDTTTLKRYLEGLVAHVTHSVEMVFAVPKSCTWADIVDLHSCAWDRGRLLGTIKRRRNLQRRYALAGVYDAPSKQLEEELRSNVSKVLYAVTLRQWEDTTGPHVTLGNFCSAETTFCTQ